jgi:hypothetical protein
MVIMWMLCLATIQNTIAKGIDVLEAAVLIADTKKVQGILEAGKRFPVQLDVNKRNAEGRTPIMQCGLDPQYSRVITDEHCVNIVHVLSAFGADSHVIDKYGWNAVSLAASRGLTGTIEALVLSGVNPNTTDQHGRTALMTAVSKPDSGSSRASHV